MNTKVSSVVLFTFLAAVTLGVAGEASEPPDFEVEILRYSSKVSRAIPVEVTTQVRNVSGKPITITSFGIQLHIVRADGKDIETIERAVGERSQVLRVETLPPDWSKRETERVSGDHEPGTWLVTAVLSSNAPYALPPDLTGALEGKKPWKGEIRSETVTIEIEEPSGDDVAAYHAYVEPRQDPKFYYARQLRDHPTSTYAANIVYKECSGLVLSDPQMVLRSIETGSFAGKNPVPDPASPRGWTTLEGEEVVAWREKWFGIVLSNHPDIWFADELRLRLALDQVALGNQGAGTDQLEALARDANETVGGLAREFLSLMIEKGMIERDSVDENLVAKLPTRPVEQ